LKCRKKKYYHTLLQEKPPREEKRKKKGKKPKTRNLRERRLVEPSFPQWGLPVLAFVIET